MVLLFFFLVKTGIFALLTPKLISALHSNPQILPSSDQRDYFFNPATASNDKPSRALVLHGDALARFINPAHTHLHSLASKAACGFLSLPHAPPSESEDERIVREFAHLLDAFGSLPTISERFMGMKGAIVTNNPGLTSFGGKLGFTVFPFTDSNGSSFNVATHGLLKLLGFQEGKANEASQFDIVFVHIGAGESMTAADGNTVASDVEYMNALVHGIMNVAEPSSEIGSRLHLSLVASYGHVIEADCNHFSILTSKDEMNPCLSMLLPRQSYTMRGGKPRDDVRHHCPTLIAQLQYAVTRMDMAGAFSFKEFKELGGNLVIPVDRFLHEVAFKLWKAPKYGA